MARHALARGAFLIAVILWLLPGCTLVSTIPSKAPKHAYLRVIAKPSSATLFLNDKSIGSARVLKKRPQRAQPGTHRLRIEAPHYFPTT